jgi:hypothetical protein
MVHGQTPEVLLCFVNEVLVRVVVAMGKGHVVAVAVGPLLAILWTSLAFF